MTTNLLKKANNCEDGDRAARIIMDALGIETDELANFCLKRWPSERNERARVIGHWLAARSGGGLRRISRRCRSCYGNLD